MQSLIRNNFVVIVTPLSLITLSSNACKSNKWFCIQSYPEHCISSINICSSHFHWFFFSLNDFIASNDIFVPYASRVKWVSYMLLCLHDFPAAVVQTSGEFRIICTHIFIWLQSIFICIAFLFYRKQRHIPRFPIAYISVISFLLLSMCGCVCVSVCLDLAPSLFISICCFYIWNTVFLGRMNIYHNRTHALSFWFFFASL